MADPNTMYPKERLYRFVGMLFLVLSFFLIVLALKTLKEYQYVGYDPANRSEITVGGSGDAFAIPDVAVFTFGVTETDKTVPAAQDKVTTQMSAALKVLKDAGIEDKDIKTIGYTVNPQYDYSSGKTLICANGYCPPAGRPVLIGYEVTETIQVKIRKTDTAGDIVTRVGQAGANNVSGIDFQVDDETKVQEVARDLAITDAKDRAEREASALGVHLVRIVSFSEGSSPIYYKTMSLSADSGAGGTVAPEAAALPQGQNKYSSSVQITYEIR